MRQHYNNTPSQDSEEFLDSSLQTFEDSPPSRRRLRVPLWKRLRGLCVVLVFLGIVELGAASLTASHFSVTDVRVKGLTETSAEPVQHIAQELVGQNWFRVHSGQAVKSIRQIPTVESVQVRRVLAWPPQLEVIVQERQPFALIGEGNQWWTVDANGVPYQMTQQPNTANLEIVSSPNFHPQLGKPLPAEQWNKVTTFFESMQADQQQSPSFQWDLRRVNFDRNGNVSLRLKDALHQELLVELGNDQWAAKLKRARLALAYLDKTGQRAKVLDFVSYKIPTWIPLSSKTASGAESENNQPA